MDDQDGVISLDIMRRKSDEESPLRNVTARECRHPRFIIDQAATTVECAVCHQQLNPMWVLGELANKDSAVSRCRQAYREQASKEAAKLKCKCQHCGKMTRISRSSSW